VRKKNGNAGPSVLDLARANISCGTASLIDDPQVGPARISLFSAWGEADRSHFMRVENFPFESKSRPAFIIRGALSREECSAIVSAVPFEGDGYMSPKEIKKRYRDRIVHRLLLSLLSHPLTEYTY
jgi:hypothetical protein